MRPDHVLGTSAWNKMELRYEVCLLEHTYSPHSDAFGSDASVYRFVFATNPTRLVYDSMLALLARFASTLNQDQRKHRSCRWIGSGTTPCLDLPPASCRISH